MTNRQKFEKTFGFAPNTDYCPGEDSIGCPVNTRCMGCSDRDKVQWWDSEYIERPTKGKKKWK